jgi:RND family efflux transporter MFP subunit
MARDKMPNETGMQTQGPKRSVLGWILLIAIPILIIIGFFVVTQIVIKANKKPKERKRSFNTLSVLADYARTEDVKLSVKTQGEARPQIEIDLVPQVSGQIIKVSRNFIEGGIIRKGETLLEIEPADYEIAVIQAEADVAQAEQNLIREVAEGEIARRDIEELGIGTPSALALREPQRAQAEAAVKAAKGRLRTAQLQLGRTKVRAPFNGRVRAKSSDIGQFVSPGARLGQIFSTDVIEVRLPLTDNDLYKVNLPLAYVAKNKAEAPKVKLSAIIAGQRREWAGYIMRTDSVIDVQTRALSAIVEVYDPFGAGKSKDGFPLVPGLFVDAAIDGRVFENIVVIPRDGLRPEDKVYLADDKGKVEIRDVSVIDTNAERAVISSGLKDGDLVVLSPMEPSRTRLTLKVADVNDPSRLLVDPPEPEWSKKAREKKEETSEKLNKWREKKAKKDGKAAPKPLKKSDQKQPKAEGEGAPAGASEANGAAKRD